ncbi:uncharacterized protein LOC111721175 [Sarcophilus harrisii]|uniref:uncharacterized protein LOC111721175 n=1 Tax=Sarcophilus harrisii TaxID=9305 RepID=UPI0013020441|nr:uncharacterized protein LOC111721175 [Sarcophilus harrisii]
MSIVVTVIWQGTSPGPGLRKQWREGFLGRGRQRQQKLQLQAAGGLLCAPSGPSVPNSGQVSATRRPANLGQQGRSRTSLPPRQRLRAPALEEWRPKDARGERGAGIRGSLSIRPSCRIPESREPPLAAIADTCAGELLSSGRVQPRLLPGSARLSPAPHPSLRSPAAVPSPRPRGRSAGTCLAAGSGTSPEQAGSGAAQLSFRRPCAQTPHAERGIRYQSPRDRPSPAFCARGFARSRPHARRAAAPEGI